MRWIERLDGAGGGAGFGHPAIIWYVETAASAQDLAGRFLELHNGPAPLIVPNPWDIGSARVLQWIGFLALATTSSGLATTLGRIDGAVDKDETLAHAAAIVAATELPVTADLVNGFTADPTGVAQTVTDAAAIGLAGCSIEDFTGSSDDPIYERRHAVDRIVAAAEAAHAGPARLVLTARAENHLHGRPDLADTIARLQAFQEAGADVLFAPGVSAASDVAQLVRSVDRPVNVLLAPNGPTVPELAELGVRRVSVGGTLAYTALNALVDAARELHDQGTLHVFEQAAAGRMAARAAFPR
jgi:2-methylisocitrate lyase-like PEP mutase family enzyme